MSERVPHQFDPVTLRCLFCGAQATSGSIICSPHPDYLNEDGNDIRRERAAGVIVPERQRCICPEATCLDHCRACNHSGRDLEETCIADPDWEPDDENLAIREARQ